MKPKKGTMVVGPEVSECLLKCIALLRETQQAFLRQPGQEPMYALFDAIRLYFVPAAAQLDRTSKMGVPMTDEAFRAALHDLLDLGINDYQFNSQLHSGVRRD